VTITGGGGSGTVTSVATVNGLSGGTITSTGTLTIAAPTLNSIGSYASVVMLLNQGSTVVAGSDYSAGTGNLQVRLGFPSNPSGTANSLTGIWRWMSVGYTQPSGAEDPTNFNGLAVRVS
jgi:hypothetical protein